MTTHVTTHNPVRSDVAPQHELAVTPTSRTRRGWAVSGIGAGVLAVVGICAAWSVDSVYTEAGDRDAIVADLSDKVPSMLVFHVASTVAALLLAVFALGLFRRLRAALPGDSLLPGAAAFGLLGTALVTVIGTGLNTEFTFAATDTDQVVPESLVFYNHWIGTIPMVWVLAGLTGLALVAAARRGAVSRVVGFAGLAIGGLTLLLGISPLQYMAGMTGPLLVIVVGAAFALGDKAHRARA